MADIKNKSISLENVPSIPKEKLQFAKREGAIHDTKFDTKPIGFFKDAMNRFTKNKSSVVAAFIILFLVIYAVITPIAFANEYNTRVGDNLFLQFPKLLPKAEIFEWAGWDGCQTKTISAYDYHRKMGVAVETGLSPIVEAEPILSGAGVANSYLVKLDSYYDLGMYFLNCTKDEYKAIQDWQDETGIQVIYPYPDYTKIEKMSAQNTAKKDPNIWYLCNEKGVPVLDSSGDFQQIYKERTQNSYDGYFSTVGTRDYVYASYTGTAVYDENGHIQYDQDGFIIGALNYSVRVSKYNYFQYVYGFEPSFVFGTNAVGQDIFYRLAKGAQFSFILAISVSAINLTIGTIYGAIEGYYGGVADMAMERVRDVLGGIPFMVLTTLFQLHFADKVGVIGALLFAFIATGWLGMAGTVRMQFYRFKNQEYVLAARTLGAKDRRIMFKHIFPNALGTIVTSCVLVIPGVIFSESSLTYLGIINLESSQWTSVGTMLALGRDYLNNYPHIILFPALYISLLEISFNLFGNGLRDAFNPSLRGAED